MPVGRCRSREGFRGFFDESSLNASQNDRPRSLVQKRRQSPKASGFSRSVVLDGINVIRLSPEDEEVHRGCTAEFHRKISQKVTSASP